VDEQQLRVGKSRVQKAIDWKPQRLPELIRTLHSLVKLQHADLNRSRFGQGNFQLHDNFLKHLLTHQCWHAKSEEQKERLYTRLMKDCGRKSQQNTDTIAATCHDFTVPVPRRLAKKPHQNKRPRVCLHKDVFKSQFEIHYLCVCFLLCECLFYFYI
jgi:hypothetical protein